MGWYVVTEFLGIVGQPTVVRLVPRLRPARTSVLALLFLVRGRRLGRSPRRFIRPLKLQHQINQLVLAQMLQISPIHRRMDSEIATRGKGGASVSILILIAAPKKGVGNYVPERAHFVPAASSLATMFPFGNYLMPRPILATKSS